MIRINGNVVGGSIAGRNIIVSNNRVIVDGKDVTPDAKEINIVVEEEINEIRIKRLSTISKRTSVF